LTAKAKPSEVERLEALDSGLKRACEADTYNVSPTLTYPAAQQEN
jgi:hypothetical protein